MEVNAAVVMRALHVRIWCIRFENCRTYLVDHDNIGLRVASTTNVTIRKTEVLILGNRRNARKFADFCLTRKWKKLFENSHESKSPDLYRNGMFSPIFVLLIA
jgi:hypothetical protein